MKAGIKAAIFLAFLPFALAAHAQDLTPNHTNNHGISSYTTEIARVEGILRVEDDGYKSVTYVITWKGNHIGVEDPLSRSDHQVGDVIKFMVSRWHPSESPEPKVLSFTLVEPHAPKTPGK